MKKCTFVIFTVFLFFLVSCRKKSEIIRGTAVKDDARPWVFWYWMHGAVSKEGIRADLEAMKRTGIGGAYIFSIKDTLSPSFFSRPVRQLTPEYWETVRYAFNEANRLGLNLAYNVCDGFATAGGPWITPDLSMQKVVWSDTLVSGSRQVDCSLPQPETQLDYYRDIAVFAFPAPEGFGISSTKVVPEVTTSLKGVNPQFLAIKGNTRLLETKERCWIQYAFSKPFTCRSVRITAGWYNYQANRLKIEVSQDGICFTPHIRLQPYRHGWEDVGVKATHLIEPVTARFFRFVYDPEGTEPGSEDLDNAKWSPELRISGIELSAETKLNQFEGKSGAVWRIAPRTTERQLSAGESVDPRKMLNLTSFLGADGRLKWNVPEGKWVILRMGYTPTGYNNATGGGGKGPECDKFNPEAVTLQFNRWFGEACRQIGPDAVKILKIFHVDSWECGSQNWSPVFREEFLKRRGYDLLPWLPVMAGIPLKNSEFSERVLYDVRLTISELVVENFYHVLAGLARDKNFLFSAESVAPVFTCDGMMHFRETDLPMGEFWFRTPSHDKPNDIQDAVSGAHIYGKNIVQAEAFTQIHMDWDEHPGLLKPLADLNFGNGINRMVFHVFTHNPWMDRKPGMTLDKIGVFLQRDQTWWEPGKAWVEYLTRCQELLQAGSPVTDIAVFTGEEIPSRAVLPDRLSNLLPGIMGEVKVRMEKERLENKGLPVRDIPAGVFTSSNMFNPFEWADPLNGYKYDSFNRDALLRLARVENGNVVLPGGAAYKVLVIPGTMKMNPEGRMMSVEVAQKLLKLAREGATLVILEKPEKVPGWQNDPSATEKLKKITDLLFSGEKKIIPDGLGGSLTCWTKGKGLIVSGPVTLNSFEKLGIQRDFAVHDRGGGPSGHFAWNHRKDQQREIYFISNLKDSIRTVTLSFRITGKIPELVFPVSGETVRCTQWRVEKGHTLLNFRFHPYESLFVVFEKNAPSREEIAKDNGMETKTIRELQGEWKVQFDPVFGGPAAPVMLPDLADWSRSADPSIRFYSGTALYSKNFDWKGNNRHPVFLEFERIDNLAEVRLNGRSCGICWTPPFRVRIDEYLYTGENKLEIAVTNTWQNRLIGDHALPEEERITWTTDPFRLGGRALKPAGLTGRVMITQE